MQMIVLPTDVKGLADIIMYKFVDPEGSLSATTVVLVLVVIRFRKMPKALLIRNGKLRNFACTHIHDIIPDRSTVLYFLPDVATFRVRSTFRTCFPKKFTF